LSVRPKIWSVRGAIGDAFAGGSRIVCDLSEASFIDSTVLAAMIDGSASAREQEDDEFVVVARPGSVPRRLVNLAGAAVWMEVYDSREAALAAVHS
jgi:anti-anti-sigma regulatory factor